MRTEGSQTEQPVGKRESRRGWELLLLDDLSRETYLAGAWFDTNGDRASFKDVNELITINSLQGI